MGWSDDYFERLLFHSSFASETPTEVVSSYFIAGPDIT
jgi:hypothetical protein